MWQSGDQHIAMGSSEQRPTLEQSRKNVSAPARHGIVRSIGRLARTLSTGIQRIRGISLVHATYVPHDETTPHAHALTSIILFHGDTVSKIYAPGLLPRLIYWLSFQAPFPYMRNPDALHAAVLRRNLAGKLTEYWYGTNRVAPALRIEEANGYRAIVSEFVSGGPPTDRRDAQRFLFDLADRFDEAGLPTWQVDPRQPRAMDNIIERPEGTYTIIDLESGLVSPLASPRAWKRALARARVPIYDDVYFDLTRAYIEREADSMRRRFGDEWLVELRSLLDEAETASDRWHASEPRIWSRIVGLIVHRF